MENTMKIQEKRFPWHKPLVTRLNVNLDTQLGAGTSVDALQRSIIQTTVDFAGG